MHPIQTRVDVANNACDQHTRALKEQFGLIDEGKHKAYHGKGVMKLVIEELIASSKDSLVVSLLSFISLLPDDESRQTLQHMFNFLCFMMTAARPMSLGVSYTEFVAKGRYLKLKVCILLWSVMEAQLTSFTAP